MTRQQDDHESRLWLLVVPLLLLTAWLAARHLNTDAVWYDEFWSLMNVGSPPHGSRTLVEIWNANLASNFWEPPGYYLALAGWGAFVGWTHFVSRALSLLFGLLAVAMTYRLAADLFSPVTAIGAAVALGASAFFIDYLHEMRSYTMFVFLVAAVFWLYWRVIQHKAGRLTQAGLAAAVAASLYLHYYAVAPLSAVALYHLLFVRKDREWWRVVILMALGGALFLPWMSMALTGLARAADGPNYVIPILTPEDVVRLLLYTFGNGSVALLALLGGLALTRRGRAAGFVWFGLAAVLVLMLLVNLRLEILIHIRHMLTLWPLLAVIVGLGIARLAAGGIHPALPLAIWILAGIGGALDPAFVRDLPNTEPRLDWKALSATLDTLRESAQADDVMVIHVPAGDLILNYYLDGIPAPFKRSESFFTAEADYYTEARRFMADARHVWYVTAPEMPPFFQQDELTAALKADHALCDQPAALPGMQLTRYARRPGEPGPYRFGEGIRLTLLDPIPAQARGHLPLLLGWSLADEVPRQVYSVALHVENAAGQLVQQDDYGLPTESFACAASDIALDNLPPGEYTVLAAVYAWETGDRLPVTGSEVVTEDGRLALGKFEVDA